MKSFRNLLTWLGFQLFITYVETTQNSIGIDGLVIWNVLVVNYQPHSSTWRRTPPWVQNAYVCRQVPEYGPRFCKSSLQKKDAHFSSHVINFLRKCRSRGFSKSSLPHQFVSVLKLIVWGLIQKLQMLFLKSWRRRSTLVCEILNSIDTLWLQLAGSMAWFENIAKSLTHSCISHHYPLRIEIEFETLSSNCIICLAMHTSLSEF